MSRNPTNFQFLHVNVTLTLNEDSYDWHDPRVSTAFEFTIPTGMFTAKQFAEVVEAQVKALPVLLEAEKVRYEAQVKANEEAERVKAELESTSV